MSFWLAHWYEFFILLFFGMKLTEKIKAQSKFAVWQIVLFVLLCFGLLSILLLSKGTGRGIEGFRLDLFFLLMIFLANGLPEERSNRLIGIYLAVAIMISFWAVIERFLPVHYWQNILNLSSNFGFGNYFVGLTPRSDSIFNGPSQLSNYLLPAAGLMLARISSIKKPSLVNYLYYCLILLGIGFAYSRAAWIGLAVLIFFSLIFVLKNWPERVKIIIISIIMLLIPLLLVKTVSGNSAAAILTHDTSQASHENAATKTLEETQNRLNRPIRLFFGSGLGSAGPLILKYQDGLIPESWYLQIFLELGIFGLVLWLWLMTTLFLNVIRINVGLALGLVAVSVAALFLHTFADSPATSYTLFLLIGASFKRNSSTDLFHR